MITLSKILALRDDEAIGVIIHEISHIVGGELFGVLNGIDLDSKADFLACEWGFGEEISAIRAYLERDEIDGV